MNTLNSTSPFAPPAGVAPPAVRPAGRRVTDAPTRMFHWLFALCFVGAYLSADSEHWRAMHVSLGYTLAGLLMFRVLYGLFGPRQARLGALLRRLGGAPAWLRSAARALRQRAPAAVNWQQAQYLIVSGAVVVLLVLTVPLVLSGYAAYNEWGASLGGDWLEEVHEFFGEACLALAVVHVAALVGLSLLRRKNQALPMLTGRVAGTGPDLAKHNRGWLAALLLAAVLAFVAWHWQQAAGGIAAVQGNAHPASDRAHEDDD
jgi:cytochrome b